METSFRRSLQIQRQVLWALMLREVITRFGRENIGVLWLIGEPMIFTLGITALWTATGMGHGSNLPIVAFAITGYSSVLLWRNMTGRCTAAIASNRPLLFHRNVRPLDLFLARILLEVAGATGSFVVLLALFGYLEMVPLPDDIGLVVVGWLYLAWVGGALALFLGAASAYSELIERLWHPAAYMLFPIAGAGFMVDSLPPKFQEVVLLLPMVHGLEMLREGYFGSVVRTHYDVQYLTLCNALLTLAGMVMLRGVQKKIEGA
jgi:ABC-type polysaccharide/polyol phosphate export permease